MSKDIKELFLGFQRVLEANLVTAREAIPHPGKKGEITENKWVNWLSEHLPERYKVGSAFAIDHEGSISEQLDLVIYDRQYSPFIFNQDGIVYIPAESIYAVFDVKQTLNKDTLEATAQKIRSVRVLKRTSAEIYDARGVVLTPKPPIHIIGGILCTSSDWSPPLGDSFESLIKNMDLDSFIDLGCIIEKGSFMAELVEGQVLISRSTEKEILITFFLQLLMKLQKSGTVTAMEISSYAKVLDSM